MDEFTISIPRERPFSAVAGLVVGGIAARQDVTLDVLDDIQLALDELLDRTDDEDGQVTIEMRVADGTIATFIGPITASVAAELEQEADDSLGLRRLLEAVADSVAVAERDGGRWVELRKSFELERPESA